MLNLVRAVWVTCVLSIRFLFELVVTMVRMIRQERELAKWAPYLVEENGEE